MIFLIVFTHLLDGKVIVNRLKTQDNICKAQQKQKEQHDAGLSEMQFKIRDLVLLYQSQLRGKQNLQERWKGSYYVHEMLGNGAYKLRMIEGKILKVLLTEVVAFPPLYTVTAELEEKFDLINTAIERAKCIDDRILMLVN
ncbi:unnamed protein product [Rhizophagus irregularis]|nr:unnamed protein product [Rhizophagus irregularis]CAB4413957.1 unnamed protein product [Rhizophagus irregularis]